MQKSNVISPTFEILVSKPLLIVVEGVRPSAKRIAQLLPVHVQHLRLRRPTVVGQVSV